MERAVILTLFYTVEQKIDILKSTWVVPFRGNSMLRHYFDAMGTPPEVTGVWSMCETRQLAGRQQFVSVSLSHFRECVLPAFIMASDAHKLCVMRQKQVLSTLEGIVMSQGGETPLSLDFFSWRMRVKHLYLMVWTPCLLRHSDSFNPGDHGQTGGRIWQGSSIFQAFPDSSIALTSGKPALRPLPT